MQLSTSNIAVATTALVVSLAGCSGGSSQLDPAAEGGTTQSVVRLRAPAISVDGNPGNRTAQLSENRFTGITASAKSYLYASDNSTGNVDIFPEDHPTNPIGTCAGCGGWGLAVSPESSGHPALLAIGKIGGTVEIYNKLGPSPVHLATLTLSGGSSVNSYGLCWARDGGLYADNWPTNAIDFYNHAKVIGGGAPTKTLKVSGGNTVVYYIACDNETISKQNILLSYGYNQNAGDNVEVDLVAQTNGAETLEQIVGNLSSGTGFPGGLAIDAKDDLVANDQYGTFYDLGNTEPWTGSPVASCKWGFNPNDLTSIVFDNAQDELWAGNLQFIGAEFAQSYAYPLIHKGNCKSPGSSGGPTTEQSGETGGYLGVAVWPNKGN
jgi:hypothetical protein